MRKSILVLLSSKSQMDTGRSLRNTETHHFFAVTAYEDKAVKRIRPETVVVLYEAQCKFWLFLTI